MNSNKKLYPAFAIGAVLALVVVVLIARVIITANRGTNSTSADMSKPATLTLTSTATANTASVGDLQHITWTSSNYSAATVAINIIRKVSDNPISYELVRQVASSTANDGDAVWVPALSDVGPNTYIQVACVQSAQACTSAPLSEQAVAVVNDGKFSNTASAYQAIEAEYNN